MQAVRLPEDLHDLAADHTLALLKLSLFATGSEKKPARSNSTKVFDHAGLLVNKPPGTAGLPFT
jgi:hypothetical protein